MAGVSLTLARDADAATPLGFSLVRTIADEAELLLLAVVPAVQRRGIGQALLDDFIAARRGRRRATRPSRSARRQSGGRHVSSARVSSRPAGAAIIIAAATASRFDALTLALRPVDI